jgi:TRAP transporter TAXI family solute receptor
VVAPMQGPEAQIGAVNQNDAQLMLIDATNGGVAIKGQESFKGRPQTNLRAIANLMPFHIGFVVRKDAPYKTIADLKGQRLPSGWTAFRQSIALQEALLGTAGLTMRDFKPVPTPEIIREMGDFKAGRMDAAQIAVGAPVVRETDAAVGGLRFLPIPNNAKTLAAVKAVRPDFYLNEVKPGPANVGVEQPMYLLAFDDTLSSNASLPDEAAYKLAKAVHENKKALAEGHPTFFGFDPKLQGKQFSILRYHPGAIKYYKEIGIWPAK